MKTVLSLAYATAALLFSPGAAHAVDAVGLQGVKSNRELQQELNGTTGFGPLERSTQDTLFGRGRSVKSHGDLSLTDGSERVLLKPQRLSLQNSAEAESLPAAATGASSSEPMFEPDPAEDFQD